MAPTPKAVKIISTLGVLPFVFGVVGTFQLPFIKASFNQMMLDLSILYAALILSFLGGCLFGFESLKNENLNKLSLWISVLPTFWALIAIQIPTFSASILAIGFLLVYEIDRRSHLGGAAPKWWLSLRFPLTASVILLLSIIGFSHGN